MALTRLGGVLKCLNVEGRREGKEREGRDGLSDGETEEREREKGG